MPGMSLIRDDDLRRLAATVPRLLSVRVETATDTVSEVVGHTVDGIAEALLGWHDWLIGGPPVELRLADDLDHSGSFRPRANGRPDIAELASAAYELRRCAASVRGVVQLVADEAARRTGQELSDILQVLAELLSEHVDQLRELGRGGLDPARSAARLSVAERSLHRKVLATLRA